VMAAAVTQARQRVVLGQDADARPARPETAAEPAANRGREPTGRMLNRVAVTGDRGGDARGGAVLLERGLRVGMDRPRECQDLLPARLDGGGGTGFQVGWSGHA